jgi:hypothetical protein
MERIAVIAPPGKKCPKENCSGWIDDVTLVPVQRSRYYRRLLDEKSLLPAPAAKPARSTKREDK